MKLLYVCAELFPLLKTGGLADVAAALPPALRAEGVDVRLLLPGFVAIRSGAQIDGAPIELAFEGGPAIASELLVRPRLLPARLIANGLPLYLLDAPDLYERDGGPYQDAHGRDWADNLDRFALFGWAAACLGNGLDPNWQPQIVHLHDWHAALACAYLAHPMHAAFPAAPAPSALSASSPAPAATVFTIHNLAYQGVFPASGFDRLGLPASAFGIDGIEFHGGLSFMKAGIAFADAVTTVSPRYAVEILEPEQGCGLDGLLRARSDRLSGILNGVDYAVWDPSDDPLIAAPFDVGSMDGKRTNKAALQRAFGIQVREQGLLFGAVTRLSEQKGLQLIPEVLDEVVRRGGQLVVLGSGDLSIEASLRAAFAAHPEQAALRIGYDEALAHQIVAGSDVVLMPSRFEPCGLTQLYGLRYGALPLVHAVGGLADTVIDASLENLDDGTANGFVFRAFTPAALDAAIRRAFALARRPEAWREVRDHAMQLRFGWAEAARTYQTLFDRLGAGLSSTLPRS